jgi:hypothetical protein
MPSNDRGLIHPKWKKMNIWTDVEQIRKDQNE